MAEAPVGTEERARQRAEVFGLKPSHKPNMGDPRVVEAMVRDMLQQVVAIRKRYNLSGATAEASSEAQGAITKLQHYWAEKFDAANPAYEQTMGAVGQHAFIHAQGYGEGPDDAVLALVSETILSVVTAMARHEDSIISDNQMQFEIDSAVEDCTYYVMGLTNGVE